MPYVFIFIMLLSAIMPLAHAAQKVKIATFNVSMEATNYVAKGQPVSGQELTQQLLTGSNKQIQNIAEVIQRVRPDIILLNEFDYGADSSERVKLFQDKYLSQPMNGQRAIAYPYFYTGPVNTGVDSGIDLNNNGKKEGKGSDAFGFGLFPGHYGMLVLSRFPIKAKQARSFQHFLWKDMPNANLDKILNADGKPWYSAQARGILRLSSKSHWDLPVDVKGKTIHLLVSHPTPPVFDGPEKRNKHRNHDEIRFGRIT